MGGMVIAAPASTDGWDWLARWVVNGECWSRVSGGTDVFVSDNAVFGQD